MNTDLYQLLITNDRLFQVLQVQWPLLHEFWKVMSYGYGFWMPALAGGVVVWRYLNNRRLAVPERADALAEMMAVLILGFALLWCAVYTTQTITIWPRPSMLHPDAAVQTGLLYWHEGFPASAPAIAMFLTALCWRYVGRMMKPALVLYVAAGSVLPVVTGQSWAIDVVVGLFVGFLSVRLARAYYYFGVRLAGS